MYAIQALFTLCISLSWIIDIFYVIGHYGHSVCCFVHLGVIIFTGISRYSTNGMRCAEQVGNVRFASGNGDKFSYADHAKSLEALFISACALFCFYNFFISVLSKLS